MSRNAFDPGRFNITYDEILHCYQRNIHDLFEAYLDAKLKKQLKTYTSADTEVKIAKSQRISLTPDVLRTPRIDLVNNKNVSVLAALAFANVAAGCHMLDGRTVPLADINRKYSMPLAKAILDETIATLRENAHRNFVGDIHIADTVRIIRFLQITGFLKIDRARTKQISLGAFTGIRDLNAIHSVQKIQTDRAERKITSFRSYLRRAEHTVLIDPSDDLMIHYERLNSDPAGDVLAINETADAGFDIVANKIVNGEIEPRNLVVSLRIDHRMIPDAEDFFSRLRPTLADTADLVMTFGAGDNPEQFLGRIKAFDEIENHLSSRGMSPVRLRMYDDSDENVNANRESPLFGIYQFASHEAMYCRLEKKRL